MRRPHPRRSRFVLAAGIVVSLATFTGLPATATAVSTADDTAAPLNASDALARKLGFQLAPKETTLEKGPHGGNQTNPVLSLLPDPAKSNQSYWNAQHKAKSKQRRATASSQSLKAAAIDPLPVDEIELTTPGSNDSIENAQRITKFGSAADKQAAVRIQGKIQRSLSAGYYPARGEDDGSIGLAEPTDVVAHSAVWTTGTIGDGPHGSGSADPSGDFDFYAIRGTKPGQQLVVDVDAVTQNSSTKLDTGLILWDAEGNYLADNDDDGSTTDSLLSVRLPVGGDYFVSVTSNDSLPVDPLDSGSGAGAGKEGDYLVTFGLDAYDLDYYAVNLKAGDILSGSVRGAGTRLAFFDPDGQEVFGSMQDGSVMYPLTSPLSYGGNAVAEHVAPKDGRYYVSAAAPEGGVGDYDITLQVFRPNTETRKVTQTIFLDFDGERLNTRFLGGWGTTTLSPLSAFLGRWSIPTSKQNALIDQVIATVTENLKKDLVNAGVKIKILNSRDHEDPFGQPDVSRLIIGGTINEAGVDTIGIAQSIDPGNFDTEETALILLDVLSEKPHNLPFEPDPSLNSFITPASDRVKFVGTALGNVASHEAGHFLGNWHVDQFNSQLNVMDQGGNFPLLFGVGADGIGGTADDQDVDFGVDELNPNEGFTGMENTLNRIRRALAP